MRNALIRLKNSGKFRAWVNRQLLGNPLPPAVQVERDMHPSNLIVWGRRDGRWVIID